MKIAREKQYDILVAGGGLAGVAAAVQAARMGKKVVIVEKTVQLGGLATIGLVNFFVSMCNGRGVQIIKGMADEFLRLAVRYGYDDIPEVWRAGEPGLGATNTRLVTHFSAPVYALALLELTANAGVDVLFDSVVTDLECVGGHIAAALVYGKSGYTRIQAQMFVDTTGDGDLLCMAGIPTVSRGNYHTYIALGTDVIRCRRAAEAQDIEKLYCSCFGGNAALSGKGHPEGMPLWDGTDSDQISAYLKTNQLQLLENIKSGDRQKRDLLTLPAMAQFRTTRHIDGDATLRTEDMYCHQADSIGAICNFEMRDQLYEVPYGTLVKTGFDNIITAGRSAAADGYAWEILRVIPPAILTGQAAGMAASMALDSGCPIARVDIAALQKGLADTGVIIHFNDAWVPGNQKQEYTDIGHI